MKFLNRRGVVTVFLCLILPALLISGLVLTDAAVLRSGRKIVEEAAGSAAYMVLGNYSTYLMENYGIYGFGTDEETAFGLVENTMMKSLEGPGIYDFRIEEIGISFSEPLSDPEVMKEAVLSVASDDLYKNLIEEFLERLDVLDGMRDAAEAIKYKMKADEAVRKFREAGELLNDLVNGNGVIDHFINNMPKDGEFIHAMDEISRVFSKMKVLEGEIEELRKVIESTESEDAGKINLLEEAYGVLREEAARIYSFAIEVILTGLREANEKAMDCISTMIEEKIKIHALSETLEQMIDESEGIPEYLKQILLEATGVLRDAEEEAVGLVLDTVRVKIEDNISRLHFALLTIERAIEEEGGLAQLPEEVSDMLLGYNMDILFSFSNSGVAGKEEDKRGFFEELGKRVLDKRMGRDVEIEDPGSLPSVQASQKEDEDSFEVTATGESTKSAESAMEDLNGKEESLMSKAADSLCINEYLMNHLVNCTSKEEPGHFFNKEIEYILWGNPSQNLNSFYTKSALMGTRFVLNAIHVYTDAAKKAKADAIAAATAGWWTMGAGIPVMSNLVRCAWAIAEAGFDVSELCRGQKVAIIKRKSDWVTDIGTGSLGVKSPDFLCMDYEDYMRIFLITCSDGKKMARLADIIQLNSVPGFDIFSTYACINLTITVSFRSMTGGRHEEIIEISKKYTGDGIS